MANQTNALALLKRDTVDVVADRIRKFQETGELHFPANYSAENAMKQAWLALQEVKDKAGKPALEACTRDSIANALLSMVVQGLSPDKKQCYFIVYGKSLTLQRSYFGTMAVAKRVCPAIDDIYAEVIYEGDEFDYEIRRGKTRITKHAQSLENINKDKIIAAYCTVVYKDDSEVSTIMTLDQIKEAWRKSKVNPVNAEGTISPGSTHEKYTEEMCKKTVIGRACKPIINSSDDSSIVIKYALATEQDAAYEEMREGVAENANAEAIVIDDYEVNSATGEVMDAEPPVFEDPAPPAGDPGPADPPPELEPAPAGLAY
jgi:recombination protein RecT